MTGCIVQFETGDLRLGGEIVKFENLWGVYEVSRPMDQNIKFVAIVGFPKTGKTKLKNYLEDALQDKSFQFLEMPGIVMLGRNTPDEERAYDLLLGRGERPPSSIVAVVDAAKLDKQLYLVFQLIDLRLPLVLCLTGEEAALASGISVDREKLAAALGIEVFNAFGDGLIHKPELLHVLRSWEIEDDIKKQPMHWRPSAALADAYQHLDTKWIHKHLHLYTGARLVEGLRLLTVPNAALEYEGHPAFRSLVRHLDEARKILEERNQKWTTAEVVQRSKWIGQALQSSVHQNEQHIKSIKPVSWWQRWFKTP